MKQSKLFYKTIKSLILITFNAILLTLFSCSNVISTRNNETTDSKVSTKAQLSLSVENNSKRTILPDDDYFEDMEYVLEGFFEDSEQQENDDSTEDLESTDQENSLESTNETESDIDKESAEDTESTNSQKPTIKKEWNSYSEMTADNNIQIDEGNWTFKLYVGHNGNVLYTGELSMTVASGTNHLVFTLTETSYSLENGSGAAEVTLMLPNDAEIKKVEAGLLTIDYESVENFDFSELEIDRWNTVTYSAKEIPSGVYIVQFKFYSEIGEIEPGFSELIQIKDGRTSHATRRIKNLAKLHAIKYENINGAVWADGYTLRGTLNEYECITLPTASEISMPDCTFGGWFSDADYSGTVITEIPAGTLENVTIYAKWVYSIAPAKIASKVTAIAYDGKVHISWVATKSDNYTNASVYLVSNTEKEKIGITENHTSSVYGTYSYLCYEKPYMNFDGVKFEIHAMHKCGAESENYVEVVGVETGLPMITVDTKKSEEIISKETYVKMNISVWDNEKSENRFSNTEFKDGIRRRGNSTYGYAKKPYRIKFDKKTSMFGLTKAKSWVLLANHIDPTLLLNDVALKLGRTMELPFTNHGISVDFILNGKYLGTYLLTEQVQVGSGRVDINEEKGILAELDVYYDEEPKFKTTNYQLPVMFKNPEAENDDVSLLQEEVDLFNELDAAVYNGNAATVADNLWTEIADVSAFAKFLMCNQIVKNSELGHPKSTYIYRDAGDEAKFCMGPLWDFDWAFGKGGGRVINSSTATGDSSRCAFFRKLYKDDTFKAEYKSIWNTYKNDISAITDYITDQKSKLGKSAELNRIVWGFTEDTEAQIDELAAWWTARVAWIDNYVNGL